MFVSLLLSVLLGLKVVLLLAFGHNIWVGFFSDSPVIILAFASMTPLLTISVLADSVQGVLSGSHNRSHSRSRCSLRAQFPFNIFLTDTYSKIAGVARGCGWQQMVVFVNLATFYLVGISTAVFLEFRMKLYATVIKISSLVINISLDHFSLKSSIVSNSTPLYKWLNYKFSNFHRCV